MPLRVIPLGGLGEFGLNSLLFDDGESAILVDAGLMFPDDTMLGIDFVIPDFGCLQEISPRLRALLLTHGHEDHIGALPYLMEQGLYAPIYATSLTRGLLEVKLREHKLLDDAEIHTVTEDSLIDLDPFTVEFFHTCHSFPDSVGISIMTPAGR
ncbi:MAG: ribonuclease J, partial [Thermodesulfobacteriota bacterium]|nr:ribonuclease J [Thermodesulfobacteriota bacterium]